MNKYISLLGIALLLLSGVVSAGTLTLCTGNQPVTMEGYQFQLVNLPTDRNGVSATMNILGVASPITLGVDNNVPHIYTDSATGNKIKLMLKSTTNAKCIYLDVSVEKAPKSSCTDSDMFDLNVIGKVTAFDSETGKTTEYADYCVDNKKVYEYYCNGVRAEGYANTCASGYECKSGACVKESPKNDVCYDGDSGYSYYTKGETYIVGKESGTVADYCADSSTVVEYVCVKGAAGDVISSTKYTCPGGYECSAGACVKKAEERPYCAETDGGFDIYTAGYRMTDKKEVVATDYCTSSGKLVETWCSANVGYTKEVDCPSGYECSAGACVKSKVSDTTVWSCTKQGGEDITNAGELTFYNNGKKFVGGLYDFCLDDSTLIELVCPSTVTSSDVFNIKLGWDEINGVTTFEASPNIYKKISCGENQCKNRTCVAKPTETQTNNTVTNLPLTIYVFDSDTKAVNNAYVTMYKSSDDTAIRSFYTDNDGKAYFYSWHFTAGEPVYFLASKGKDGYENTLGKVLTVEYKDGKYCVYKSGVSECLDRYSLGLFEVVTTTTNTTEVPPTLPVENTTVSYYTVAIQPGWNLISVPFESGKLTTTDCDSTTLYTLNPVGRSYNKENLNGKSWFGFEGYWMKSSKQCKLQFEVSAEDGFYTSTKLDEATGRFATSLSLSKGWNMIGAPHGGTSFSQIAGTCTLSSGPWGFNSAANSWEKATSLESGKGYFVKVTEDCVLGSSMPPLPPN